jgi:hypothetical protein
MYFGALIFPKYFLLIYYNLEIENEFILLKNDKLLIFAPIFI